MPFRFRCFEDIFSGELACSFHMVMVCPEDQRTFEALSLAFQDGFVSGSTLIGDSARIKDLLERTELPDDKISIIAVANEQEAVSRGVALQSELSDSLLFAGKMTSQDFLDQYAAASENEDIISRLSHIVLFEVPGFDRLIVVTDPTVHVAPRLPEKVMILNNVIDFCHKLEWAKPLVALIAAIEKIDYMHMPHTIDSAALVKMVQIGQIKGAVVDGPLALDNAVSEHAAAVKGIRSPVAGAANVFMMPDAEAGVLLCKILVYFAKARSASVMVGDKAPIVFPSRSDNADAKFYSMKLACKLAGANRGIR